MLLKKNTTVKFLRMGVLIGSILGLAGCSSYPSWLASSGPSLKMVESLELAEEPSSLNSPIPIIDVNDGVTRQISSALVQQQFAHIFSENNQVVGDRVGPGDILEVSVWEAPPAVLFGNAGAVSSPTGGAGAGVTALPEQMVSHLGEINVPFAGAIKVTGKTPQEIERLIVQKLKGKANQPQVLVRVSGNTTANVTVVGEVAQSQRMPLTAKGERLLDAIAAAGGVRQSVDKMTVQVTRSDTVASMPLERVIQSPKENVLLLPGDVVTLLFQPLSFTVLGATGKNEEINFEAQGISLAQALARSGGLLDSRADARGVFIFRFEDPNAVESTAENMPLTPEGKVPVVYKMDMKDPASFLVSQNFPMRDKDVLYVANAPAAELQKFLSILTSSIYSIRSVVNASD